MDASQIQPELLCQALTEAVGISFNPDHESDVVLAVAVASRLLGSKDGAKVLIEKISNIELRSTPNSAERKSSS